MTDIVQTLRRESAYSASYGLQPVLLEAAAEIDRLRAELEMEQIVRSAAESHVEALQARLAAVIALCDECEEEYDSIVHTNEVRAAATGDTT